MKRQHVNKGKILTYTTFFEPVVKEGGYIVTVPTLPGCVTQAETFEETKKMARDAIRLYLKVLKEDKEEIPVEKEEMVEIRIPVMTPA